DSTLSHARLGRRRNHPCSPAIGVAERALERMINRAERRLTFGEKLSKRANIQDWIAESRIEIDQARLPTLHTADMMDRYGNKVAKNAIAEIKVVAPSMALKVLDRAIQIHGGGGVTDDFPLARFWAHMRTLRLADGPDEV